MCAWLDAWAMRVSMQVHAWMAPLSVLPCSYALQFPICPQF